MKRQINAKKDTIFPNKPVNLCLLNVINPREVINRKIPKNDKISLKPDADISTPHYHLLKFMSIFNYNINRTIRTHSLLFKISSKKNWND